MKEVKIIFENLPPQPRNATHEKTPYGIRLSDLATAFQDDIRERLETTGKKNFFKDCDSVVLTFTVYTPVSSFLTKDDKLSKTSIDLDAHKLFLDELAKYFGFNDGLVWDLNPIKVPVEGDMWYFKVHITGEENTEWHVHTSTGIRNSQGYQILN